MGFTKSTKQNQIRRDWHLVDAKEKILGRLATKITHLLIGKSKPYFVTHLDCGDYVVVVNASDFEITGKKTEQKIYQRYSGYPGGLKKKSLSHVKKEDPTRIIKQAVSGMLPKNKLRKQRLNRLYIYMDEKHPYESKFKMQN